jgi:acyl dehydratase
MNRYLEDLNVGDKLSLGSYYLTEEEVLAFARQYDPQPMHTDPAAARNGQFGGLIASGWNTAAVVMRLIALRRPFGDVPVLGLGVDELRWPTPVRPGDTLAVEQEVLSATPSKSKPTHGVARVKATARNQNGEIVLSLISVVWVPRRPAA